MPNVFAGPREAAGALWDRAKATSARALERGVLRPIETDVRTLEHEGVSFIVRRAAALARKANEDARRNPFLDPEPGLFVADLSESHFALLNKYNVLGNHLLVATRAFVDQETLLDPADFRALAACMTGIGTLGFYNGGREAGASQAHKHLQVVPLPLAEGHPQIPIEAILPRSDGRAALPFRHAFTRFRNDAPWDAALLHRAYRALLAACGIGAVGRAGREWQSQPYNLLVTRSWMLIVPRAREAVERISVNALGFAGSLFVADDERLRTVERLGPMNVLRGAAAP